MVTPSPVMLRRNITGSDARHFDCAIGDGRPSGQDLVVW
jgi:hypothetical protein